MNRADRNAGVVYMLLFGATNAVLTFNATRVSLLYGTVCGLACIVFWLIFWHFVRYELRRFRAVNCPIFAADWNRRPVPVHPNWQHVHRQAVAEIHANRLKDHA